MAGGGSDESRAELNFIYSTRPGDATRESITVENNPSDWLMQQFFSFNTPTPDAVRV